MTNPITRTQSRRRGLAARYGISRQRNIVVRIGQKESQSEGFLSFPDDKELSKFSPFDDLTILNGHPTATLNVTINDRWIDGDGLGLNRPNSYTVTGNSFLYLENMAFYSVGYQVTLPEPVADGETASVIVGITAKLLPVSEDRLLRSSFGIAER